MRRDASGHVAIAVGWAAIGAGRPVQGQGRQAAAAHGGEQPPVGGAVDLRMEGNVGQPPAGGHVAVEPGLLVGTDLQADVGDPRRLQRRQQPNDEVEHGRLPVAGAQQQQVVVRGPGRDKGRRWFGAMGRAGQQQADQNQAPGHRPLPPARSGAIVRLWCFHLQCYRRRPAAT